jgi:flagellar biosynthesis/type III secretory pathway M-ring protein FliF/YscJ
MVVGGRTLGLPMGYEDRMAAARSVAGQDPRQVAQVVRNWVGQDNG